MNTIILSMTELVILIYRFITVVGALPPRPMMPPGMLPPRGI